MATDDYEQGTYVYFDFHISDESQHGWFVHSTPFLIVLGFYMHDLSEQLVYVCLYY